MGKGLKHKARSSPTRKDYGRETNSIAKRGQGGTSSLFVCPLRSPEAAPLVGFGATPQLFLVKSIQREQPTKGAGSEASLPVNLRVLRRAPQLALPTAPTLSRQMGATDHLPLQSDHLLNFACRNPLPAL